ncbi:hypothetical protein PCANC_28093 [Puccinia coronata f. sp. avenae]|uniref:Uncharacterized protein n=1 Tax=Puccinia coronata f. sp. avenae TaxID=200324 RepID=A0A2N5TIF7_9BASI|nr:hypothetical protein PCANC_28093 [Puccinia coronata f. sp. avenae]PLW25280.1 hypothetical protein PCASD_24789 [Puccinia coronata f. sp. avenae]
MRPARPGAIDLGRAAQNVPVRQLGAIFLGQPVRSALACQGGFLQGLRKRPPRKGSLVCIEPAPLDVDLWPVGGRAGKPPLGLAAPCLGQVRAQGYLPISQSMAPLERGTLARWSPPQDLYERLFS